MQLKLLLEPLYHMQVQFVQQFVCTWLQYPIKYVDGVIVDIAPTHLQNTRVNC